MADAPKSSSDTPDIKKITEMNHAELAKKLWVSIDVVPYYEGVLKFTKQQLVELSDLTGKVSVSEQAKTLQETLSKIRANEVTDKIKESTKDGLNEMKDVAKKLTPDAMNTAISETTKTLKKDIGKWGTEVLWAVGDIVNAENIEWATGGITKLSKAIDAISTTFSSAMKWIGDILSAFMSMLGFDKLWKSIKGLFGGSTEEKKEGDKKKEATGAIKDKVDPVIVAGEKKIAETKENTEILMNKYWDSFVKSGWITNPEKQKWEFKKIFEKHSKTLFSTAEDVLKNAADQDKEWKLAGSALQVTTMPFRFLADLISAGVIPKSAIAAEVVDASVTGIRLYIRSPYTLITKWPTNMLIDLGTLWDKDFTELSEPEKQIAIMAMHHTMTGPLWLAGKLSSSLAKISLLGMYWDQGTGFEKMKAMIYNVKGEFSQAANRMEYIMKMLGDQSGEFREYSQMLQNMTDEVIVKTEVAQTYSRLSKAGKTSLEIAQALESIPNTANYPEFQSIITELRAGGRNTKWALTPMVRFIENVATQWKSLAFLDKIKATLGSSVSLGDMDLIKTWATEQMKLHMKSLSHMVQSSDFSLSRVFSSMKLGLSQTELIDAFEKWHLKVHVNNAKDAKSAIEQLIKWVPKWFEHMFNWLAVSLIVADVSSQKSAGDGLEALAKWILSMNPLFGWGIMIYEGTTMQWSIPTKAWYLVLGWVVTMIGVRDLIKLVANPSAARFGEFLLSPITSIYNTTTAVWRWGIYAKNMFRFGNWVSRIAPLRAWWFLAAWAILSYLIYENVLSEKTKKTMETAWFFDKEWNSVHGEDLKSAWSRVPIAEKPKVLSEVFASMFPSDNIKTSVGEDTSVVIHAVNWSNPESSPITLDTFSVIQSMYKDLGITDPRIFMSVATTKSVKKFIENSPISEDQKNIFLKEFNITT